MGICVRSGAIPGRVERGHAGVVVLPDAHKSLAKHFRKIIDIRGSVGLGSKSLLLQVIACQVGRAKKAAVERSGFCLLELKL